MPPLPFAGLKPLALALRPPLPTPPPRRSALLLPSLREWRGRGALSHRPLDAWEGQRAVLTSGSFSTHPHPTPPKKDSGLTAWPAPGGHLHGPGQQPSASPPAAEQPPGWFGASAARCRGRRSSPGGGARSGSPRPSASVPTSHLPLLPHSPDPSGLGSARPLPLGSLLGFPPEETRLLLWDSTELYSFFSQDACFLQCLFGSLSGLGEELRLPRLGIPEASTVAGTQ